MQNKLHVHIELLAAAIKRSGLLGNSIPYDVFTSYLSLDNLDTRIKEDLHQEYDIVTKNYFNNNISLSEYEQKIDEKIKSLKRLISKASPIKSYDLHPKELNRVEFKEVYDFYRMKTGQKQSKPITIQQYDESKIKLFAEKVEQIGHDVYELKILTEIREELQFSNSYISPDLEEVLRNEGNVNRDIPPDELLLDILCTSRNIKGDVDKMPSVNEISIQLLKIKTEYEDITDETKAKYDGMTEENILDSEYEKEKKNLQEIAKRQIKSIQDKIPVSRGYRIYSVTLESIENEGLKKLGMKFNQYCGSEDSNIFLFDYPKDLTGSLLEPLIKLGKATLKLDVIQKIEEDITFNGVYHFYKKFNSVPDACQYYADKLGVDATRKTIKHKIKNSSQILENEEELEWSIINKRINSWVSYESNKPNSREIPKK